MEIISTWDCPNCQFRNVDYPDATSHPLCEQCGETYEWDDLEINR